VSTTNGRPKPIALDHIISEIAGQISLFGGTHDVRTLDGEDYQRLKGFGDAFDIVESYGIVAKIVPSLSEADVKRLNAKTVGVILAIADGRVKEVEAQFPPAPDDPNGERPSPASAASA
jgi:hypothetical protein